jgi:NAD(P)-dependent dehydrogenase (short-subunit alcohol dehydrogenase family)
VRLEPGQVAVITGAASGIGRALAGEFARRGLAVVISDVQAEPLAHAATELQAIAGADVLAVKTDVRDPCAVDALAAATLDRHGRVDVVCNNAGVGGPRAPMWEQEPTTWRWVIDVALLGVVHGIRSFVPELVRQNRGHVLNTASVGGLMPLPLLGPYNAAKHGVIGLSETLRAELEQFAPGVGVTVLCPGPVDTNLTATTEANRPADVPGSLRHPGRPATHHGRLSALEVARKALAGIERDDLHVMTHPDYAPLVRARIEAVLADLSAPHAGSPAGVAHDRL